MFKSDLTLVPKHWDLEESKVAIIQPYAAKRHVKDAKLVVDFKYKNFKTV